MPTQRHAEKKAQARHNAIASDGPNAHLGKMQLEESDFVGHRRIG
jgi:hypothetical protein